VGINLDNFQKTVDELLIRHRSILDTLSKLQEANGKINRAVAKSVTRCGCLRISARRQEIPPDTDFLSWKNYTETHLDGELCERCREVLESELGESLFIWLPFVHCSIWSWVPSWKKKTNA